MDIQLRVGKEEISCLSAVLLSLRKWRREQEEEVFRVGIALHRKKAQQKLYRQKRSSGLNAKVIYLRTLSYHMNTNYILYCIVDPVDIIFYHHHSSWVEMSSNSTFTGLCFVYSAFTI